MSKVKFLEEHIKELNKQIDQWIGLCSSKDEIIDSYRNMLSTYSMTDFKQKSTDSLTHERPSETDSRPKRIR